MSIQFSGSYLRKSDGAHFTYVASILMKEFKAKVFDENGDPAGTPSILWAPSLESEASVKASCKSWIEGCIEDRVGVR